MRYTNVHFPPESQVEEYSFRVLIYTLSLANALEIDASAAVLEKLERNEQRFPVEVWRGRADIENC